MPERPNCTLKGLTTGITVLRADDLDPGVRRASGLSRRNAEAADYQDDEKLHPTANRRKHRASSLPSHYSSYRALH
jgi:hypothetical protein